MIPEIEKRRLTNLHFSGISTGAHGDADARTATSSNSRPMNLFIANFNYWYDFRLTRYCGVERDRNIAEFDNQIYCDR
jgi:hypothetical protein